MFKAAFPDNPEGTEPVIVGSITTKQELKPEAKPKEEPNSGPKEEPKPGKPNVENLAIGKAALELTSTVVNDRSVKFIFRVRNFGTDFSPITAWIEKNGVLKRKILELGLGMGTWDQTSITWPPRLENGVALFEIVLTRQ